MFMMTVPKVFSIIFDNIPNVLEYVTHTVEEFAHTFVYFSDCLKDFCNVVQEFLQFLIFKLEKLAEIIYLLLHICQHTCEQVIMCKEEVAV